MSDLTKQWLPRDWARNVAADPMASQWKAHTFDAVYDLARRLAEALDRETAYAFDLLDEARHAGLIKTQKPSSDVREGK